MSANMGPPAFYERSIKKNKNYGSGTQPLRRRFIQHALPCLSINIKFVAWLHLEGTEMDSQTQNTSLQRLQNVEKTIVRVLELAGGVMDELANPTGPRKEFINNHCREFMQMIKDIQFTLRNEIKSACEYRPFEKCDYSSRIANEICSKKLEYIVSQLEAMKQTVEEYHTVV